MKRGERICLAAVGLFFLALAVPLACIALDFLGVPGMRGVVGSFMVVVVDVLTAAPGAASALIALSLILVAILP